MITIHHEKETDFSKNGYGAIDNYVMNQEVYWEMNGQFYAYLEYPAFLDKADYLVNKNILRIPVPFMDDQLFRIYRTRKVLGFIQVEARHIFYDLMDNLIEDTNIVGKNGSQAVQQLLAATQYGHQFTGLSDITTTNNARMVRYNPVEALLDDRQANTFVSRWGGEVVRDNFMIRMAKQMGSDRGVHIQHKKDLLGYEATIDESTVVTRIMPIGFDGLKLPELYIDSPLIDLNNPKIRVIKYDDVKAATGMYAEDEDAIPVAEAYALLRKYAKEEFSVNHLDEPETTVTVNFASLHNTKEYEEFSQLQEIQQGDVVKVSVPEEGFEITSRLVAFTSDPLQKNHYTSTTLGNHVFEFTSSSNDTTRMRNEVEQLRESVVTAMQAANGKNRNFWGTADPNTLSLNASVGDNYYRENGEETTLYRYVELNGERYWKEIIDTSKLSIVADKVGEAMAEAEQAKEAAEQAYEDAVDEAERLVAEQDEVWQGKMEDYDEQVALIDASVTEAQTKAEQALTEAGISTDLAQTAKDLATTAKTNAQTAVSNASQAIIDAGSALSQAQELGGHFNDLSFEVDEINGKVDLRLTSAEVDSLVDGKGFATQTWANNQITATAKGINANLTKVEGKIDNLEIGGRNYLLNTKDIRWFTGYATFYDLSPDKTGLNNQDTILSFEARHIGSTPVQLQAYFRYTDARGGTGSTVVYADSKTSHTWKRFVIKFTDDVAPDDISNFDLITIRKTDNTTEIGVRNVILSKGLTETDWSPAPEDVMDYTNTQIDIKAGQVTTSLTSIINTKATQSDIDASILDDKRIKDTRNDNQLPSWYITNYPRQTVTEFKNTSVMGITEGSTHGLLTTEVIWGDTSGGTIKQTLKDNTDTYTRQSNRAYTAWEPWVKMADQTYVNTTINATAEGIEQLITEVKTDPTGTITGYNSLKNNVDSMVQAIGSDGGKIAQMVMTDSVFQTNVMTDGNLVQNGSFTNGSRFGWESSLGVVEKLDSRVAGWYASTSVRDLYSTYDMPVVAGETLYASIKAWGDANQPVKFGMRFFDKNNEHLVWYQAFRHTTTGDPTEYTGTIKVPTNASHGRVWVGMDLYSNFGYVWFTDAKITRSATQSQVTQLADSWALTLKSGNDIKTQINASTSSLRLSSKFIHLNGSSLIDNATIKSAHIDSLNANKITGNTADFNTIRTGVLTANAVTSTHIKAENALIDSIFGTTALIERLTSKTAFINSIKAMEIDAGKITTGELNAANVNIVNLDVNKLTGNVMNFISGAFTSNAGSLLLSGNGISVNFSNGYSLRLNGAGTNYYTSGGQPIGGLLTTTPIGYATHSLSLNARRGYTVSMGYQGSLSYNQSNRALEVDGTTGNITIERPIYESSGSAGLEFTRSQMGNVGWGLLLASTKATGSGIFLADNGEVWIGISGGYKQFT